MKKTPLRGSADHHQPLRSSRENIISQPGRTCEGTSSTRGRIKTADGSSDPNRFTQQETILNGGAAERRRQNNFVAQVVGAALQDCAVRLVFVAYRCEL
jgi:hypothetical protein